MRKPCAVFALVGMLFGSAGVRAGDHLVPRSAVDARLAGAAQERARNLASLDETLTSPGVARAAATAGIDVGRVRKALPQLSDSELRELSVRAQALRVDPVAGYHEPAYSLLMVVVIAAFVLILLDAAAYH